MKNIGIITARSGSKGLPDKNILDLNGHPLMYYTIKAALKSGCFDTVMVSTDSEKYADIAKSCGAEVPFLRSEELSSDTAGSWDVVREVLTQYKVMGNSFDYVALMQPTSPLRNAEDIKNSFKMLSSDNVHTVVSVTEVEHPVQWCFTMSESGSMKTYAASPYNQMRRQDLETHYRENGAIYIVNASKILNRDYNYYGDNCYGYVMSGERSMDIDSRMDFMLANIYQKNLGEFIE